MSTLRAGLERNLTPLDFATLSARLTIRTMILLAGERPSLIVQLSEHGGIV